MWQTCLDVIFSWSLACTVPSSCPGWHFFFLSLHTPLNSPYSEPVLLLASLTKTFVISASVSILPSASASMQFSDMVQLRCVQPQAGSVGWTHPAGRKKGPVLEVLQLVFQDSVVSSMGSWCR